MSYNVYLPYVVHGEAPTPRDEASANAARFAAEWMRLLGDDANAMRHDARLEAAAVGQAQWLAVQDFEPRDPHWGKDDSTANQRVRAEGFSLPTYWPVRGNQCESAIRGWLGPERCAQVLTDHDAHRDHMRRQGWYREHVVWGVGAAEAKLERVGWFYCLVSCPVEAR